MRLLLLVLLAVHTLADPHQLQRARRSTVQPGAPQPKEQIGDEDEEFWKSKADAELEKALSMEPNTGVAKNIIIFIGDGMSLPTVTAARVFKGQKERNDGNWAELAWEAFPHVGLSKTYCANYMVPDSAATASAMYSGVKTTFYTMGYNSSVQAGSPASASKEAEVETILDWAQAAGKRTGFVTTTRMSHATPAALYAKTVYRFWEGDHDITKSVEKNETSQEDIDKNNVKDISRQLVESEAGNKLDIMLGGGRASFLPWSRKPQIVVNKTDAPGFDYEDENDIWDNYRDDDRDLLAEWENNTSHGKRKYIDTKELLLADDLTDNDQVMGIFTNSYMVWDDMAEAKNKPTIAEMAKTAVNFLQAKAGQEGFFIMIEGGRIDAAHHNGHAVRALSETLALEKAIEQVVKLVNPEETLILVTADHAHTMSIGGYTNREYNITGSIDGDDNEVMSILSYGNGPGFRNLMTEGKGNFTQIDRANVTLAKNASAPLKFRQPSASPLKSETHGGDDVGIWAQGPWSHLIHGVHEQSYIATVMSYAGCLGKHEARPGCPRRKLRSRSSATSNYLQQSALLLIVACTLLLNSFSVI